MAISINVFLAFFALTHVKKKVIFWVMLKLYTD